MFFLGGNFVSSPVLFGHVNLKNLKPKNFF